MAPGTVLAQKKHIDLTDLIVLIYNGPRCELNQFKQLNRQRPDLIVLILLIVLIVLIGLLVLIHNCRGYRFGTHTH